MTGSFQVILICIGLILIKEPRFFCSDELSTFIESKGAPAPGILTLTTSLSNVCNDIYNKKQEGQDALYIHCFSGGKELIY